jgi:hypothetical protein
VISLQTTTTVVRAAIVVALGVCVLRVCAPLRAQRDKQCVQVRVRRQRLIQATVVVAATRVDLTTTRQRPALAVVVYKPVQVDLQTATQTVLMGVNAISMRIYPTVVAAAMCVLHVPMRR